MNENFVPGQEAEVVLNKAAFDKLKCFFHLYSTNKKGPKSILFLIGPSGCGKTSAINYLCNFYKLDLIKDSEISLKILQERQEKYVPGPNSEESENDHKKKKKAYNTTTGDIFKRALMDSYLRRNMVKKSVTLLRSFPSNLQMSEKNKIKEFWRENLSIFGNEKSG